MWPDASTPYLLLFGLVPVAWVLLMVLRYGVAGASSLIFSGVLFIWVGYHLSPWFSYISGEIWDTYLLIPGRINDGLLFSTLANIGLLAGYLVVTRSSRALLSGGTAPGLTLPGVRPTWVLAISAIVFLTAIINAGGIQEFWSSSYPRGYGQFDERNYTVSLSRMFTVLKMPLELLLSVMSSLLLLKSQGKPLNRFLGIQGLVVAGLSSMWVFSRGAGFPFAILALIAIRVLGKRAIPLTVACILIANYLGSVGLVERDYSNPGIANFVSAALLGQSTEKRLIGSDKSFDNALDAMPSFTRKAIARDVEKPDFFEMGAMFLWNLNPLPSEIVPIYQLGRGLSTIMGTVGHTGLTTPALADLYFVFGMPGSFFCFFLGMTYGWFELYALRRPGLVSSIAIIFSFVSMAVGLHSSTRAMTRPLIYAAAIIFLSRVRIGPRVIVKAPGSGVS